MEIHGKAVASIESTDDDKFGPNGGFTAVLSTPSLDRDGDRLLREEWQDLPEWLPLDVDHGMSMADTIGKFHPYWDGDQLMMDAYFASTQRAQETRTLLNDLKDEASGTFPVGVSVAFITDRSKKDGEPRRELLNAGVVAIPSNRDAKILASKEYLLEKEADQAEADAPADTEAPKLRYTKLRYGNKALTLEEAFALLERLSDSEAEDEEPEEEPLGHWCMGTECCEEPDEAVALQSVTEAETKAPAGTGDTAALTQAIHDASVHLGAMCYPLLPDEDPTGASDGANKSTEGEIKAPDVLPEGMTKDQFVTALTEVLKKLTPESPEEPAPVEETAAASPADLAQKAQLLRMRMRARHYNIKDN